MDCGGKCSGSCNGAPTKKKGKSLKELNIRPLTPGLTKLRYIVPCYEEEPPQVKNENDDEDDEDDNENENEDQGENVAQLSIDLEQCPGLDDADIQQLSMPAPDYFQAMGSQNASPSNNMPNFTDPVAIQSYTNALKGGGFTPNLQEFNGGAGMNECSDGRTGLPTAYNSMQQPGPQPANNCGQQNYPQGPYSNAGVGLNMIQGAQLPNLTVCPCASPMPGNSSPYGRDVLSRDLMQDQKNTVSYPPSSSANCPPNEKCVQTSNFEGADCCGGSPDANKMNMANQEWEANNQSNDYDVVDICIEPVDIRIIFK